MKKSKVTPIDTPRAFEPWELFFSITDLKGVISCCNDIFVRVGAYPSEELIQKPHNVIRHPDMPRCFFKVMWDYLLSGKIVSGYVKNMAKTGEYYWVYALVVPLKDEILSIRIRPEGETFEIVKGLYQKLVDHEESFENDWRAGMASAEEMLLSELKKLGYASYDDFMLDTLAKEYAQHRAATIEYQKKNVPEHRWALQSDRIDRFFGELEKLNELRSSLARNETVFLELDQTLGSISINSGVRAARLGDSGAALAVVSNEIAGVSKDVSAEVKNLSSQMEALSDRILQSGYNLASVLLFREMNHSFEYALTEWGRDSKGIKPPLIGAEGEEIASLLQTVTEESLDRLRENLSSLSGNIKELVDFADFLGRTLQKLDFVHVTGNTLAASLKETRGFELLLTDLIKVSSNGRTNLNQLQRNASDVQLKIRSCRETLEAS